MRAAMGEPAAFGTPDPEDVMSWFEFGDDELLAKLSRAGPSRKMAMRLVTRDLPKRSFAIYREVCETFVALEDVFDPKEMGGPDGAGQLNEVDTVYQRPAAWRLFDMMVPLDPSARPRRLAELKEKIRFEAIEARKRSDRAFRPLDLGADDPYVGFSPRYVPQPINEVRVRTKTSIGHSGQWTKSEELSTAENLGRSVDHVYADRDWLPYVAAAARAAPAGAPRDRSRSRRGRRSRRWTPCRSDRSGRSWPVPRRGPASPRSGGRRRARPAPSRRGTGPTGRPPTGARQAKAQRRPRRAIR